MSFKDDYKNELDNIRTDGYIKEKVLRQIKAKEEKPKLRFPIFKAIAVAACILLVIGVAMPVTDYFRIGSKDTSNAVVNNSLSEVQDTSSSIENENMAESYNSIYEKVKELQSKAADYEGYVSDDMNMIADEAVPYADENLKSSTNGVAKGESSSDDASDFSETTAQVEGVDEADIVKTDGEYIYSLSASTYKIRIIKAGKKPQQVATIPLENVNYYSQNLYLNGDRLVVFGTEYGRTEAENKYDRRGLMIEKTAIDIYDISDPANPKKVQECSQDGGYTDSRLIGDKLYMISNYYVINSEIDVDMPKTYVPAVYCGTYDDAVPADSVYINPICNSLCYTVICGYDITDGSLKGTQSILGGTYTVYCSTGNIITVGYSDGETQITRYAINDGEITLKADGKIDGTLLNQFSIDEHNGYFRFVTTEEKWSENTGNSKIAYNFMTTNSLYVLDGNLKQVGSIEDLAPDERVYSVRFMGDMAYFVTFRQVDPLFSADLSDPENPKIVGSLKIPGFSNYLYPFGEGLLFGIGQDADEKTGRTGNVKLSMFDISDPANVTESAKKILDISYTEALYSHKATLIDAERNLIGFDGYAKNGRVYNIYSFEKGSFVLKAQIAVELKGHNLRGLYIGDEFYIVTDDSLLVYDLNSFELVYELTYR